MMAQIKLIEIPGVSISAGEVTLDSRGSFTKFFERENYVGRGFNPNFNSLSIASNIKAGTLRGLHFQISPHQEEKLISCIKGRIFDVIVDLRKNSPTLGKWAAVELTETTPLYLSLPGGIAHGYQTLTNDANVLYGLTSEFCQGSAFTLSYLDLDLEIDWPMTVTEISEKDSQGLSLHEAINLMAG